MRLKPNLNTIIKKREDKMKKNFDVKNLVLAGLFLALGLVMPFLTAQIPQIGSALLPMHLPVLLCGFVCGAPYGLIVGAVVPLLRSVMFGMPPMMVAVAMAFELAAYGAVTGLLHKLLYKKLKNISIYISLIGAMIAGRIVWGVVSFFIYKMMGNPFTWEIFAAGAVLNALPGIILQIILIPILVLALMRAGVMKNEK